MTYVTVCGSLDNDKREGHISEYTLERDEDKVKELLTDSCSIPTEGLGNITCNLDRLRNLPYVKSMKVIDVLKQVEGKDYTGTVCVLVDVDLKNEQNILDAYIPDVKFVKPPETKKIGPLNTTFEEPIIKE